MIFFWWKVVRKTKGWFKNESSLVNFILLYFVNRFLFKNESFFSSEKRVIYADLILRFYMLKKQSRIAKESYVIPLILKEKNGPDFLLNINGINYTMKSIVLWNNKLSSKQIKEIYEKFKDTCDVINLVGESSEFDFEKELKEKIKKIYPNYNKFLISDLSYMLVSSYALPFPFVDKIKKMLNCTVNERFSLGILCLLSFASKSTANLFFQEGLFLKQKYIKNLIRNFKVNSHKSNISKTLKIKKLLGIRINPDLWYKYMRNSKDANE